MAPKTNNCDPENCNAMPQAELEARLENIFHLIEEVREGVKDIKEDTRSHYKSILEQQKDIEFLKEKLKEEKEDIKEKFEYVQKEFSRRDKNNKWFITMIISIAAIISSLISYFMQK